MSSSNLTQLHAARPLTGALSASTDLFYVADVSETTDANIDKGMTRHELLRAIAESARLGGSKYLTPFLPQITGLTGGGTTKLDGLLDGLVVTDAQIPFAVDLSFSDDYQRWKLRVKAVGEVADGVTLIAPVNTAFSAYIFCRMPIPNTALGNSTITLGSSTLTLGSTTTTVAGLTLTSPTLTTPALGTPASGVATNLTGTAPGLTAGNVTTNANLTGDVLSSGNATTLATVATAGTSGSSTSIPVVTINAKGLTTSITTAAVIAPAGTLTGATLASGVTASSLTTVGTLQSPVMVTPALGTPASGVATNLTGLPLTTGVTGTLAVTNGGTGVSAAPSNGQILIGNGSGFVNSTLTAGTNITITNGPGSITIEAAGGSLAAFEDGTAAEPSIAFINELSTGVFRASTNVLGFAVGGASRATMTNTGMTVAGTITPTGSVHAASGTVGDPSLAFNSDKDTGLFRIGPNNIGVAAGGATVLDIATTGLDVTGTLSVSGAATLGAGAILGTPSSATLTNATGLPISTGVSGLGANVAAFLATPSSANLATAVTDETGTGALVFGTSPTLTTPISATLTSPASTDLTLGLGTGGTALTLADTTLAATFAGTATFNGGGGIVINGATKVIYFGAPPNNYLFFNGSDLVTRINAVDRLTIASTGDVSLSSTTPSSSAVTGALQVAGGIGAAGASYFGGAVLINAANPRIRLKDTTNTQDEWHIDISSDANQAFRVVNNTSGYGQLINVSRTGATTFAGAVSAPSLTLSTTPLAFASGGTGATTAGSALAKITPIATTVTSATAVTLTNTSANYQIFTGSTIQTILLPVTSTLETGWTFSLCNNSSATLVVQSSGGNTVFAAVPVGTTLFVKCIGTTLTTAADWEANLTEFSTNSGTGSVVLNSNPTFSAFSNTGTAAMTGAAASAHTLGTNLTTGTVIIGGAATTGTLTFGQSTAGNTINISAGLTASGATKTLNIGTGGLAGSATAITIGSATGTSTTEIKGDLKIGNAYVAGAVVGTGYITIQDSTGTTYRIPVLV